MIQVTEKVFFIFSQGERLGWLVKGEVIKLGGQVGKGLTDPVVRFRKIQQRIPS